MSPILSHVSPTTLFLPPSHPPNTMCTQLRGCTGREGKEQLVMWRVYSDFPRKGKAPEITNVGEEGEAL